MGDLPKDVHVGALLNGRIKEIAELSQVVQTNVRQGKLASQQVPRHMRRRAVSHDVRRLPRRLRAKYLREKAQGGGDVPAGKRPSRKFRRRASNLLAEYNRRQRNHFWMETHIWHAKRFHMFEKWGYKIPEFPNDKCWRACYRATKSTSLMFDISYNNLLQITGGVATLLSSLNQLTRGETKQVFEPPPSHRERTALLSDGVGRIIGEVGYTWLPAQKAEPEGEEVGRLWIFCHPAYVTLVIQELKMALNIPTETTSESQAENSSEEKNDELNDTSETDPAEPPAKKVKTEKPKDDVNLAKLQTRNVPCSRAPSYCGANAVEMIDFQGTVNRFRLVGPKSLDILKHVCVPADLEAVAAVDESPDPELQSLMWWRDYYTAATGDDAAKQTAHAQNLRWENVTCDRMKENMSLVVRDPRLLLPLKKGGPPEEASPREADQTRMIDDTVSNDWEKTPFFNSAIRDQVSLSKCSDAELNSIRSKQMIPGTRLNLGVKESRIPVAIFPVESGLDLLVPAGWGMSFWLCLVFHGCRVGGNRELDHLSIEQGNFPALSKYPESVSCRKETLLRRDKLKCDHFALPPNKRVNFTKLGIASPFEAPLDVLVNDWRRSSDSPSVSMDSLKVVRNAEVLDWIREGNLSNVKEEYLDQLVAVRVSVEGKGRLVENTIICLPTEEDLQEDISTWEGPVDSLQSDSLESKRREARESHQKTKKRLKRQWKKLKDKQVLMKTQSSALGKPLDTEALDQISSNMKVLKSMRNQENTEYSTTSEELWLGDFNTVRHSCRREIIGYVTAGNMSYRTGGFVGQGFVVVNGLVQLQESTRDRKLLVLTREPTSLQYRFSSLRIL